MIAGRFCLVKWLCSFSSQSIPINMYHHPSRISVLSVTQDRLFQAFLNYRQLKTVRVTRSVFTLYFFLLIFFLEGSELSFFTFIKSPKESRQEKLIETVEEKRYPKVCGRLTAKALMDYSDNPLIFAIKVMKLCCSSVRCIVENF